MPKLDTGRALIKPPAIPSKWDIIPIHNSDRAAFKACRRRWSWSSPSRLNLSPRVNIIGIIEPLWYGTGIHYALEKHYNPYLREDPVGAWLSWFTLQAEGGIISEAEVSDYLDRDPSPHPTIEGHYSIRGLKELLPDPDAVDFDYYKELGVGMMTFYKRYAELNDNFAVMMVEHDFSVPITVPGTGQILMAVDKREDSPNYGKRLEVHARGKQDLLGQDLENGSFGLWDNKTAARVDDDYFRHLDLDEQVTMYWWASEREAAEYDLEYGKLDWFVYNALRKAYPREPTITSRGLPSLDRSKESTTAAMFEACIDARGLRPIFEKDVKMQAYYEYLVSEGDKVFIQRDTVRRNPVEIRNFGEQLYYEACDMIDDPSIYPNPTKDYTCLNCVFRAPCKAQNAGYDVMEMLSNNYRSNIGR